MTAEHPAVPGVPFVKGHGTENDFVLLPDLERRTAFIDRLKVNGIQSVFHYIPLHSSPFGRSAGRSVGDMSVTDDASERLARLPLWLGLEDHLPDVIPAVIAAARAG